MLFPITHHACKAHLIFYTKILITTEIHMGTDHNHLYIGDTTQPQTQLMRYATYASVLTAAVIIVAKMFAWFYTDSLSLLSSLVDSILDIVASIINLFALRYALKPADEDHRFGHGKAEDIAAFSQSAFIAGSAIFIGTEAISRFLNPTAIEHSMIGIWVMLFSIIMTTILVMFQRYVVKRTKSTIVEADSLHYLTDFYVNIAVIVALLLYQFFDLKFVDPIFALGIAAYIFYTAWKVARKSFDHLMDKEFEEEDRQKIIVTALQHPLVKGLHDLRTRSSGIKPFIQFHLELDGDISLTEAHTISDEVEALVMKAFPNAEVLIHQDPEGLESLPDQVKKSDLP